MNVVRFESVPAALRDRVQWVLWKTVTGSDGKPTKLPYQLSGKLAESNNPATWTSFEATKAACLAGGYDGIGYVFAEEDPFCGIDLDGCRDPKTGAVDDWAKAIIVDFKTYTEVSPSQTGVKLFLIGKSPFATGRKKLVAGQQGHGRKPAIEVYDKLRYFAVTGWKLAGVSAEPIDCQAQLEKLCASHWKAESAHAAPHVDTPVAERARKYVAKLPPAVSGQSGHNVAFHAACILVMGFGLSEEEAYPIFCEYSDRCEPPWNEREIRHKLRSATQQPGQRCYLRDALPEQWPAIKVPQYRCAAQPERKITTLKESAEKYLGLVGETCNLVSLGISEVDYAIGGGCEFGEMVAIGARPGHGKSAFALQAMHVMTQNQLPGCFISEEMSALALGKRTIQYASAVPSDLWHVRRPLVTQDLVNHFSSRSSCHVVESCGSVDKACEEIDRLVRTEGVKVAAVDYAQLLRSHGKTRYEQITNTSIMLRQLASSTQVVLLVLCQLSRGVETREKFIPKMQDLKDTGQLEQDADVILFLLWPHRLDSKKHPHEYVVFVGKNRNRPVNQDVVKCKFLPSRQQIVEPNAGTQAYEPSTRQPGEDSDSDLFN